MQLEPQYHKYVRHVLAENIMISHSFSTSLQIWFWRCCVLSVPDCSGPGPSGAGTGRGGVEA